MKDKQLDDRFNKACEKLAKESPECLEVLMADIYGHDKLTSTESILLVAVNAAYVLSLRRIRGRLKNLRVLDM